MILKSLLCWVSLYIFLHKITRPTVLKTFRTKNQFLISDQSGPSSQVRLEPIQPKYPPPNPNLKPKKRAAPPKKRAPPAPQKTAVAVLPPISAADSAPGQNRTCVTINPHAVGISNFK